MFHVVILCLAAPICFAVEVAVASSTCADGSLICTIPDRELLEAMGEVAPAGAEEAQEAQLSMLQRRAKQLHDRGHAAEVPAAVPMTSVAGSHFTDVSDNQYIFMLSEEKVYDGQTLQEETVGCSGRMRQTSRTMLCGRSAARLPRPCMSGVSGRTPCVCSTPTR
mmetsp:Transcript_139636/g.445606  ORF Transcript_139636/g.445606 Transcript_139636/m.445606 type:complete len:165 (-) Transcript_139636:1122-1616(-)